MEKAPEQNPKKTLLWDCDSSLYDSFELRSFKRQLDSAITSRTMSMPRLSDPTPGPQPAKKPSKLSRSLHRLLRSLFRSKPTSGVVSGMYKYNDVEHGYYGVSFRLGALSTIPEACEKGFDSPEFDPVVMKSVSARFSGTPSVAAGISCHVLEMPAL